MWEFQPAQIASEFSHGTLKEHLECEDLEDHLLTLICSVHPKGAWEWKVDMDQLKMLSLIVMMTNLMVQFQKDSLCEIFVQGLSAVVVGVNHAWLHSFLEWSFPLKMDKK